ncbi:5-oxoprolinase subunit C family protein [Bacillus sp. AK031]
MGFSLEKSGLMTTIQDGGRIGYRNIGMPVSGPMDPFAFHLANLLLQNDENCPGLEITLQGPVLHFTADTEIAICGADLTPSINDQNVMNNKPLHVRKGDVLRFGMAASGMRAYIAFKNGINNPKQLGSTSTNTRAGVGGIEGRALKAGDKLDLYPAQYHGSKRNWGLAPSLFTYMEKREVRVLKSTQWDSFNSRAQADFLSGMFTILPQSDRMGYRLEGPRLELSESKELLTEGIAMGTIQVPSNGQPIILMADSQPTGGYPKIANVITADLSVIAQLKPNENIAFREVSLKEAHLALRQSEYKIRMIKAALKLRADY